MKILGIMFLVLFVFMFLFGKVTINKIKTDNIWYKFLGSLAFATIFTLILGLPLLGIIKLLGF